MNTSKKQLFWIGDSTVQANTAETWPQCGMGQEIASFLKNDVSVLNLAKNGRSTKSFLDEGRFVPVEQGIRKGDLLLITFGHNDEKSADPTRYCAAEEDYSKNLLFFAQCALDNGAYPVLFTPLCRRLFADGKLQPTHGAYPDAVRALAAAHNLPLIDLTIQSHNLVAAFDEAESCKLYMNFPAGLYANYPEGSADNTHLRHEGAHRFCELIARGLLQLGGPYAEFLLPAWAELAQNAK